MARRVYLDTCAIQRPFDTPTNVRIVLEAEAVLALFGMIGDRGLVLVSSEVLAYECDRNPHPMRRRHMQAIIRDAAVSVGVDQAVVELATRLKNAGIKPLDALHIASAAAARSDWFCTTDDGILRRRAGITDIIKGMRIVSPLQLVEALTP